MWRYLTAAFWARPVIPGLGALPVNAVTVAAFVILGIGNPGFWFLGVGLEISYLWLLIGNQRFRRMVDAPILTSSEPSREALTAELIAGLGGESKALLSLLEDQCRRILTLQKASNPEDYLLAGNREALERLRWTYLKLLVAETNLRSAEWNEPEIRLRERIAQLDRDVAAASTDGLREAKLATREIMARRLANRAERDRHLAEIAADQDRIVAQVELARENALIQGRPMSIAGEVELASTLLDFGSSAPVVGDLDRAYQVPQTGTSAATSAAAPSVAQGTAP